MTATQDDTIAELQRANAELRRERDTLLIRETTLAEALAQRNSEFGERIAFASRPMLIATTIAVGRKRSVRISISHRDDASPTGQRQPAMSHKP